MTSTIGNKLDPYGPATCVCGNRKETIYAGERYQLTCRNHPGHPLYEPPTRDEGLPTTGTRAGARESIING